MNQNVKTIMIKGLAFLWILTETLNDALSKKHYEAIILQCQEPFEAAHLYLNQLLSL